MKMRDYKNVRVNEPEKENENENVGEKENVRRRSN